MDDRAKIEKKIDTMLEHEPTDVDEIIKLINKIEGTHGDRYLLAQLVSELSIMKMENRRLDERVKELERVNERMGETFRNSEYY